MARTTGIRQRCGRCGHDGELVLKPKYPLWALVGLAILLAPIGTVLALMAHRYIPACAKCGTMIGQPLSVRETYKVEFGRR